MGCDTYGYLTTNYYKGRGATWDLIRLSAVEIHGTAKTVHFRFSDACWRFTGDYSRDAFAIIGGLDHELSRMSSGSYRNVEVKR